MELIKQLGGYDLAKNTYEKLKTEMTDKQRNNKTFMNAFDGLSDELLQYRREKNIFEVGDKVVIRKADGHPDLFTYESISKSGNMHFFESPFNYGHLDLCKVRHATDAEIQAGHRLD